MTIHSRKPPNSRSKFVSYSVFAAVILILSLGNLAAQSQHGILLTWTEASTTPGITYNVYRSTVSGGPYTKINTAPIPTTTFEDTTGTANAKYFYVVTASLNGIETVFSTEASAVFPLVPATPAGVTATPE